MAKHTIASLALGKLEYGTGAPSCTYDGVTRYIRITDIDNNGCLGNDFVSPEYYEDKHLLKDGDILFARTGATVGKTYIYHKEDGRCVYAGFLIRVIPNQKIVLPSYLYYFTKSKQYLDFVANNMKVVAQPNINAKQYGAIELSVPNIDAQKEVVSNLDKLSQLISLRKKQLQKLDDLVKSRFVEMFGDPVANPLGWRKERLVDVCSKLTDGTHFSPESNETGDYKYVTAKNIKKGGFDFSNITYVSEEVHRPIYQRCNPVKGDVLYIKDGATTGIAIVNNLDEEFSLLSSVALLKYKREIVNGYFLCEMLNNNEMYFHIRNLMGGAAITRLTIEKLNNIVLIVPPINLQEQFANYNSHVYNMKMIVWQGIDKLDQIKQALMQKYFG